MSTTRDNSGSISKNKRKEKETHPDIKGQAVIDGRAYWISGWAKSNDNGPWYSLSLEPKQEQPAQPAQQRAPAKASADLDEIPF